MDSLIAHEVTELEFKTYLTIQKSGKTNMFDTPAVENYSLGVLNHEKISYIMHNYGALCAFYHLSTRNI